MEKLFPEAFEKYRICNPLWSPEKSIDDYMVPSDKSFSKQAEELLYKYLKSIGMRGSRKIGDFFDIVSRKDLTTSGGYLYSSLQLNKAGLVMSYEPGKYKDYPEWYERQPDKSLLTVEDPADYITVIKVKEEVSKREKVAKGNYRTFFCVPTYAIFDQSLYAEEFAENLTRAGFLAKGTDMRLMMWEYWRLFSETRTCGLRMVQWDATLLDRSLTKQHFSSCVRVMRRFKYEIPNDTEYFMLNPMVGYQGDDGLCYKVKFQRPDVSGFNLTTEFGAMCCFMAAMDVCLASGVVPDVNKLWFTGVGDDGMLMTDQEGIIEALMDKPSWANMHGLTMKIWEVQNPQDWDFLGSSMVTTNKGVQPHWSLERSVVSIGMRTKKETNFVHIMRMVNILQYNYFHPKFKIFFDWVLGYVRGTTLTHTEYNIIIRTINDIGKLYVLPQTTMSQFGRDKIEMQANAPKRAKMQKKKPVRGRPKYVPRRVQHAPPDQAYGSEAVKQIEKFQGVLRQVADPIGVSSENLQPWPDQNSRPCWVNRYKGSASFSTIDAGQKSVRAILQVPNPNCPYLLSGTIQKGDYTLCDYSESAAGFLQPKKMKDGRCYLSSAGLGAFQSRNFIYPNQGWDTANDEYSIPLWSSFGVSPETQAPRSIGFISPVKTVQGVIGFPVHQSGAVYMHLSLHSASSNPNITSGDLFMRTSWMDAAGNFAVQADALVGVTGSNTGVLYARAGTPDGAYILTGVAIQAVNNPQMRYLTSLKVHYSQGTTVDWTADPVRSMGAFTGNALTDYSSLLTSVSAGRVVASGILLSNTTSSLNSNGSIYSCVVPYKCMPAEVGVFDAGTSTNINGTEVTRFQTGCYCALMPSPDNPFMPLEICPTGDETIAIHYIEGQDNTPCTMQLTYGVVFEGLSMGQTLPNKSVTYTPSLISAVHRLSSSKARGAIVLTENPLHNKILKGLLSVGRKSNEHHR